MIDQTANSAVSDLYDLYQGLSHQAFIIQIKKTGDTDFLTADYQMQNK